MKFPHGFLFGSATSAHQIEGHNSNSDWWEWEKIPGNIKDGSTAKIAADSWNKWKKDINLLKQTHQNAYRFSIEWARIEPEKGRFDQKVIKHYKEILLELQKNKIKGVVTLFHVTLPKWVAAKGGFTNFESVRHFENYVKKVAREFNGLIDYWIPTNEANIYIGAAYLLGIYSPGKRNPLLALLTWINFVRAQRSAYKVIKKARQKNLVGVCVSPWVFKPLRPGNILDQFLVRIAQEISHSLYLRLTINSSDFIAANVYSKHYLKFGWPMFIDAGKNKLSYWSVLPETNYDTILELYRWKKSIIISENGVNDPDDNFRPKFITEALKSVSKAISEKMPVKGFFHWSLLDNFEWSMGYSMKFGLFTIDRKSRKSAFVYKKLIDLYSTK